MYKNYLLSFLIAFLFCNLCFAEERIIEKYYIGTWKETKEEGSESKYNLIIIEKGKVGYLIKLSWKENNGKDGPYYDTHTAYLSNNVLFCNYTLYTIPCVIDDNYKLWAPNRKGEVISYIKIK